MVDMSIHPQQAFTQHPNPAPSCQKFEMGGGRGGVALRRNMFMGANTVLIRGRDGMVTSAAPEEAWLVAAVSQSVAAESGPARNEDPSDWCLPPALPARPACLPPACACACLLVPLAPACSAIRAPCTQTLTADLRLEQSWPGLPRSWAAAGLGLVWSGALGYTRCRAMRCDRTGWPSP